MTNATTMIDARRELKQAHAARHAAERARDAARQATGRARMLLQEVIRQAEVIEADAMRDARERAAEMRASFRNGSMPTVAASEKDASKATAAVAALDIRREAAEGAVADLSNEERQAEAALERANEAVASAIKLVIKGDAEKLAERWAQVDEEARRLRLRLGTSYDFVSKLRGIEGALERAIAANNRADDWRSDEGRLNEAVWTEFAAALMRDPEARVEFGDADRGIAQLRQERENSRLADERLAARARAGEFQ